MIKERRPFDIEGYVESDRDYCENNNDVAVALLDFGLGYQKALIAERTAYNDWVESDGKNAKRTNKRRIEAHEELVRAERALLNYLCREAAQ